MNIPENISLRNWFAGMAMMGMCANPDISSTMSSSGMIPYDIRISIAESAYKLANEMLAQSEKASDEK